MYSILLKIAGSIGFLAAMTYGIYSGLETDVDYIRYWGMLICSQLLVIHGSIEGNKE